MESITQDAISRAVSGGALGLGSLDDAARTAAAMTTAHACSLCILRFLQIPTGPVYLARSLDVINQSLGVDTAQPASNTPTPCTVCLGTLDMALVDRIVGAFKEQEFDAASAAVSVELPKSVYVRHRSMQVFLKGINPKLGSATPTDLKDVIKYMVCQTLFAEHGVLSDMDSDMRID
ncbi:hypothetical protein GGF44_003610, partial [Coemansia sp. RSA 1694]